jgi:2-desacetyl-2-hydroxyethyl bacteriochlorophyllide A dehydrogenase
MEEEEIPELQADQVLIKTTKTLVSVGTEISTNTGKSNALVGRHGYSNVGRVVKLGAGVTGVALGERVATAGNHTDYLVMRPQDGGFSYTRIPDEVADEEAVFMVLGTVALHIVERSEIALGRPVIVVGQGTVGQLAQQLARLGGAGQVIAVDPDPARRELARQLGAGAAIPPDRDELEKTLAAVIPAAAPPVFIEVSGNAGAVAWCGAVAPLRARIVIAGNYTREAQIRPVDLVEREIDLCGAHQPKCPNEPQLFYPYNRKFNCAFILESLRRKQLRVRELYDGFIRPEELLTFYDAARNNQPHLRQPIINWE